jgi:transcriptional regulator with XRE-family HTH domain
MDSRKKLGKEITNIRTNVLNMTQKELAEKLNITVVYISNLELGKKIPSLDLLNNLYSLTGVKEIPPEIEESLREAKNQAKKELSESKLSRMFDESIGESGDLYEKLELLVDKGKIEEAKRCILMSLVSIEKVQERKLLEALYYELDGNFTIGIRLLREAIELGRE